MTIRCLIIFALSVSEKWKIFSVLSEIFLSLTLKLMLVLVEVHRGASDRRRPEERHTSQLRLSLKAGLNSLNFTA